MAAGSQQFRSAVRAIVFRGDEILVMDREKYGKKYRALVGGGVEQDETPEAAVIREVYEETGMKVANPRLVFREISPEYGVVQHVFICEYLGGEPELTPDSEEYADNLKGKNLYFPRFMPVADVIRESTDRPFVSSRLLDEIQLGLSGGFQNTPKKWTND